jgi:hypothetical protein
VAPTTPWPKMGLSGHPIFGKGLATTPFLAKGWQPPHFWPRGGNHPIFGQEVAGASLEVVKPPPWSRGWSGHPQKAKKEKKILGIWGWPRAWGGFGHPHTSRRGWPKPPSGPWGWSGHPQKPKTHSDFFFFAFWGGQSTPLAIGDLGVAQPPPNWPCQKWGGPATPFWPRGHSRFSSFFLFFSFSLLFFFFLKKKN